jgi:hypothetical protein
MDDPLDTLQRQVDRLSREVADYKRQAEHEATMRSLLQDRLERLERSLHGKIGRAEAISILWIAMPVVFVVVTMIAVGLVLSRPHP